jgi:tetratricopeptide (TPR) repeat protein
MPYIKEALANFREGSENYLQTLQVQWLAYFHNEDLEDATKLLKTIITPELYKKPKITRGKWLYFEAFLEFKKKNYRKSLALISNLKELRQDKSGWLLGCKLLELMNMIEINDPEQLEFYSLGTLKKLISGLEEANTKRIKLIYSILNKILKKDLSFEEAFKFCKKELETLSEGQEEFHWNPTGFELVKFDEWFRSKLNRNPALVNEEF